MDHFKTKKGPILNDLGRGDLIHWTSIGKLSLNNKFPLCENVAATGLVQKKKKPKCDLEIKKSKSEVMLLPAGVYLMNRLSYGQGQKK